jgi:hypothetical protein
MWWAKVAMVRTFYPKEARHASLLKKQAMYSKVRRMVETWVIKTQNTCNSKNGSKSMGT